MLVIGFGRFGQIVSQYLLAEELDVTAIDTDADMIQVAGRFGFKVYYGDGTRLDVLRAAGADGARLVAICIDDAGQGQPHRRSHPQATSPAPRSSRAPTTAAIRCSCSPRASITSCARRSNPRCASAAKTLVAMGIDADRAAIVEDFIRTRDHDRLAVQQAEGIYAGIDLLRTRPTPTPFSEVKHGARALNQEAGELITGSAEEAEA